MSYENPQLLAAEIARELYGEDPATDFSRERFGPLPEHELPGVDGYNEVQTGMEIK